MAKKTARVTAIDRNGYSRARKQGRMRALDPAAVVSARYDKDRDRIDLIFRGGASMGIPRTMFPGLEEASTSNLKGIQISPAGDALSWRSLDVDVYVPGLLERTFGKTLFALATEHRGGGRRSKAKAAAARAKGGRPRKGLSA